MSDVRTYYGCKVVKVIDGDTVDILVDLGFSTFTEVRFRLYGIDAPEMKNETLQDAKRSRDALSDMLSKQNAWAIQTRKNGIDKYGRYLIDIFDNEDKSINQMMVKEGFAVERYW